jgi:hypothetical protein
VPVRLIIPILSPTNGWARLGPCWHGEAGFLAHPEDPALLDADVVPEVDLVVIADPELAPGDAPVSRAGTYPNRDRCRTTHERHRRRGFQEDSGQASALWHGRRRILPPGDAAAPARDPREPGRRCGGGKLELRTPWAVLGRQPGGASATAGYVTHVPSTRANGVSLCGAAFAALITSSTAHPRTTSASPISDR